MLIINLVTFTKLLSYDFSAGVFFEIAALDLQSGSPNKGVGLTLALREGGVGGGGRRVKALSP